MAEKGQKKSTYFTNLPNKQLLENVGHELPRVIMKSVEIWPNSLPKDPKYFDISGRDNVVVAKVGSAELHLEDFRLLLKKEWLSSELIDFLVNYLKPLRLSTYVSSALSTLTLDGNVVEAEVWSRFDFKKKYVLIPYNDRGNHFVCFFCKQ